jgi:hypothetical protein
MIQIEDLIFTSYQPTMESLASLSITTQNKKASVSMIMVPELVEENKIGSVIEHVKRLATMISTAMLSR